MTSRRILLLGAATVIAAGFAWLLFVTMPAVMVEMGYLSNQEQETKMAGAEFQNLLAQAIYDAIIKFRDLHGGGTQ